MSDGDQRLFQPEVERRRAIDDQFADIKKRLDDGDITMRMNAQATVGLQQQVGEISGALAENTAMTKANNEVVTEVRNILTTFTTLGKFAKWTSRIAAAVGAALAAVIGAIAAWKGLK